ncbi:MAG: tetratricopeptide repeat protein [Burkholderia sp.]|nr:tetratricopeptide repeat protein [Burkholderia sp.]
MSTKPFSVRPRSISALPCAALVLCAALFAAPAIAAGDESSEISRLVQSGQLAEAMKRVDAGLAQKPADARLRFSKGIILAQQNKPTEAIAVLLKLTEDFPDLPEPYNNLAVLYAANGQYESARIALDKAIASNPGYGMAHENLGDVYAELASQAYEKAARIDGSAGAKAKVAAIRNSVQGAAPGIVARQAPQQQQQTGRNVLAAADTSTAAPAPAAQAAKTPAAKAADPDRDAEQAAVLAAVNAWAGAWSARDVKAYLDFYSADFVVPHGMSRDKWTAERTDRITGKQRISVKIEAPKVRLDGDRATVQFRQEFSSDKLKSTDQKTLTLVKRDGAWRIREERVG